MALKASSNLFHFGARWFFHGWSFIGGKPWGRNRNWKDFLVKPHFKSGCVKLAFLSPKWTNRQWAIWWRQRPKIPGAKTWSWMTKSIYSKKGKPSHKYFAYSAIKEYYMILVFLKLLFKLWLNSSYLFHNKRVKGKMTEKILHKYLNRKFRFMFSHPDGVYLWSLTILW